MVDNPQKLQVVKLIEALKGEIRNDKREKISYSTVGRD